MTPTDLRRGDVVLVAFPFVSGGAAKLGGFPDAMMVLVDAPLRDALGLRA